MFRYHGLLSPGVRLFRSIGFTSKALWISIVFLIPLCIMLAYLWAAANVRIQSTESERQGLTYARPLLKLMAAAEARRQMAMLNPGAVEASQEAVKSAFGEVEGLQKQFGAAFRTSKEFDQLQKSHESLLQKTLSAQPDETFQKHTEYLENLLDLLSQVSDGSELSFDPDHDTHSMGYMAVLRGPIQVENTARLACLGQFILTSKQMTAGRHDFITQWRAVWEYLDKDVENAYQEGVVNYPEVARRLDMKGTDDASDAFKEGVQKQLLGDAIQGDAETYKRLADAAQGKQSQLVNQVLDVLDDKLLARLHRFHTELRTQLAISVFFLAVALYLFLSFYKVIMGGLNVVTEHLEEMTRGNLTTAPKPWGRDEAARLMICLGQMQDSLRRIAGAVIDGANNVQTASTQIAAASTDLAHRTEESASALASAASNMNHIAEMVSQSENTVKNASARVSENAVATTRGGTVIGEVEHMMQGISDSSNRIGEIIGVIDGIAFQTNILALNAAVEAARAGENGRGFAVVASEVRALASRSANAAKEIKTLISSSIEQVQGGKDVVENAGSIIKSVSASAVAIQTQITEVAESAHAQSASILEVSSVIHQLDQTTQQNAALVEETTSAANLLADQAGRLNDVVGFFKLV